MWRTVIPADRPLPLLVDRLGSDPTVTAAAALVGVLALVGTLVAVRRTRGDDDATGSITPVNPGDDGASPNDDSDPEESEWTVSYNPPSRRSSGGSRNTGRSGSSSPAATTGASAGSSPSPAGSSGGGSAGGTASGGSAAGAAGDAASGAGSAGTAGSGGATADGSGASADGSGDTRLYDPSSADAAGTDTRIFTGEKDDPDACPDCEEELPAGTDFEFCPFCGYEL